MGLFYCRTFLQVNISCVLSQRLCLRECCHHRRAPSILVVLILQCKVIFNVTRHRHLTFFSSRGWEGEGGSVLVDKYVRRRWCVGCHLFGDRLPGSCQLAILHRSVVEHIAITTHVLQSRARLGLAVDVERIFMNITPKVLGVKGSDIKIMNTLTQFWYIDILFVDINRIARSGSGINFHPCIEIGIKPILVSHDAHRILRP